jgi:Fusaric acid resistance protein-like
VQEWVEHAARTSLAALGPLMAARLHCICRRRIGRPSRRCDAVDARGSAGYFLAAPGRNGTRSRCRGAALAAYFGSNVLVFTAGVFLLGLICAGLRLDRSGFRFATITLTIVMLIAHTKPAWMVAIHRFVEVSVGIGVGRLVTAVWPESEVGQPG